MFKNSFFVLVTYFLIILCAIFVLVNIWLLLTEGAVYSPIVGAVTENSAKICVVTFDNCYIEYSLKDDFVNSNIAYPLNGYVHLMNLEPNSIYYYRVISGMEVDYGKFKTFPKKIHSVKIGIVTDLKRIRTNSPDLVQSLQSLCNDNPDFVIILGDFDHANPINEKRMKDMYLRTRGGNIDGTIIGDFLFRQFPIAHVWDDHDFGRNNTNKYFKNKDLAIQMYDKFYPCYDRPNPQEGLWHSFKYGNLVEVFMLDLRSQRDLASCKDIRYVPAIEPNLSRELIRNDPNRSMLGIAQKDWLKYSLLSSTAKWKVIASTVTWNPSTMKDDAWWDFPVEQAELIDFLNIYKIDGVVFVSGDIHTGGAIDDGANSFFPEISVPQINLVGADGVTCNLNHPRQRMGCGNWSHGFTEDGMGYGLITLIENSFLIESKNEFGEIILNLEGTKDNQCTLIYED